MEEIVNKWSQELDSATKEFTRQASEVAVWDNILRKGGNEISRLLHALQVAEERQASIEQTLDYVEQQQADLTALLDGYEAQVVELLEGAAASGISSYGNVSRSSVETGAADAERERAYGMAESLNAQLDDLSRNLSSMIVEVNNLTSSTAQSGSRQNADADPGSLRLANKINHNGGQDAVGQIVAILNAHLGSLKWIDESTTALREKIENLRRGRIGGTRSGAGGRGSSSGVGAAAAGETSSPSSRHRGETMGPSSRGDRQGSMGPEALRSSSVGPGYARGSSVGRNAGAGWSEATVATGSGRNLGRARGYGL